MEYEYGEETHLFEKGHVLDTYVPNNVPYALDNHVCQLETSRMERRARRPFWQNVYVLRTNILDYVRIQPHARTRLP